MKNLLLVGVLSTFTVLGAVSILTPARATDDGMPVGTIIAWGGLSSSVPAGWMLCDGRPLSKTVYAELFTAIGTSWGSAGDKFNLPDLRGRFLRGDDAGTGRDPDAKKRMPSKPGGSTTGAGSVQEDSVQNHTHDQEAHSHDYWEISTMVEIADTGSGLMVSGTASTEHSTASAKPSIWGMTRFNTKSRLNAGEESRPKNAAVNFIIKVK